MVLAQMVEQVGVKFAGVFLACASHWEKAANGRRFLRFALAGQNVRVRAHGWAGIYHGPAEIPRGTYLYVVGRVREFKGHLIANVEKAEFVPVPLDPGIKDRLFRLVGGISSVPLRTFAQEVLLARDIARPFFSAPGSCSQHHSFPGGLLVHSLECAEFVRSIEGLTTEEKDVGVVSALFHDVGKSWTHTPNGHLTRTGRLVRHDYLTNEILAQPLATLTGTDPVKADFLRHLWGWLAEKNPRPSAQHVLAEILATADHVSAHRSAEELAFRGLENFRRHAGYQGRRYYRFRSDPPQR